MNKGLWTGKSPGSLGDSKMVYDNASRLEPKRSNHWFMEGAESEIFPSKKQAVEVSNQSTFSGLLNSNISPWGNASSFQSIGGQFTERLFEPETTRTIKYDARNVPSVAIGNMNIERKVIEDPLGSDSLFGLSISHMSDDARSGLNYGGIRKVKVSQVKDTENFMPLSMCHAYDGGDSSSLSTSNAFEKSDENSISMGLSFNRGDNNMISICNTFNGEGNNFISMAQSNYGRNIDDISNGPFYKENDGPMSVSQSLSKDDSNTTTMSQNFSRGDGITCHSFKESDSVAAVTQSFSKDDSNLTSMRSTSAADVTKSMVQSYNKVDDSFIPMVHSFSKSESNIISFGGFNDDDDINASGRLICSYDLLMGQSSVQRSEAPTRNALDESNSDGLKSTCQIIPCSDSVSKEEEQKAIKKPPPNSFPSNVRSLLSTGILDGVPVKYIAWSHEKELCGIIKGSGYLCGCQSCNFSKAINAYEFERHAGCKTKHPNNHIYFENRKTVYGIVQELRNTPQDLLFEVIQTITGSTINQKSFRIWKESFLAATRELQRIYGKGEGKQLS